jgi:hydrogenase-4 component F
MTPFWMAVPIVAPLLAALAGLLTGWGRLAGWANVAASLCILGAGIALGIRVGSGRVIADVHLLRVDALTALMLIVTGAVGTLATWSSIEYLDTELADGATTPAAARQYTVLVPVFLAAMALALLADNLGVIWVAVEATTVATAFLVGHRRTRQSLEATWKYVVICSFGITLAFLGTVLLYFASIHAGANPADALNLDTLTARAGHMNPAVTRLAVGFLLIGFGTKAGLVPFHTWLADAHSQAPAPVSALMSGVLLSVAFSVILRVKVISDAALGNGYMRTGLLVIGLATLLIAVSLLVAQHDFKRMLAYSSLEQMGLIAVAAAAGTPLALAGLLLLIAAHGIAKAILFITAGQLQHAQHSSSIADVTGVLARSRLLGGALAIGLLGLLGLPPFALFAGELSIARGMADADLAIPFAAALILLLVAFASIARHGIAMLLGAAPTGAPPLITNRAVAVPIIAGVVLFVALGVVGGPFPDLATTAAAVLGERP